MNKSLLLVLLAALLSTLRAACGNEPVTEWGAISNSVQIGISVVDNLNEIKTNQPAAILLHVRNLSTNRAFFYYQRYPQGADPDISLRAVSPLGTALPEPKKSLGSWERAELAGPGEIRNYRLALGEFCKFDEYGKYRLSVTLTMHYTEPGKKENVFAGHAFSVISNPLTLTVVPGEWKPSPAPHQ